MYEDICDFSKFGLVHAGDGAFSHSTDTVLNKISAYTSDNPDNYLRGIISFNLHNSNAIYGNSTNIQVCSAQLLMIIKN